MHLVSEGEANVNVSGGTVLCLDDFYDAIKIVERDTSLEVRLLLQRLENINQTKESIRNALITQKTEEICPLQSDERVDSLQLKELQDRVHCRSTDSDDLADIDDLLKSSFS